MLAEQFLGPLGATQDRLSSAIRLPSARVYQIVHNRRAITADTAVRLSIYFATRIDFWMNHQAQYDTRVA